MVKKIKSPDPSFKPAGKLLREEILHLQKELEQARTQLALNQILLKPLVDHNPEGLVVVDTKGILRFLNPAGEFLLDHRQGEFIGGLLDFSFVLGGGTEIPLVDKNGQDRVVEVKVVKTVWQEAGKEEPVFFAMLRDVTERKRCEEELKKLSQLKTDFVSMASHELKTPLTVLRESVSQVAEGLHGDLSEVSKNILDISLRAVDRLSRLIEDLLDISKMEAGKIVLNRELIDLVAAAKEAASSFVQRASRKGLEIREMGGAESIKVYADRDRVIQVFTNLIANALKFTEKGFIEIRVFEEEDFVVCRVSDTGQGIPEEELPKVFGKFEQLGKAPGAEDKGTGLGLAISKGIVELHHGEIRCESKLGEGTHFTFQLPKYTAKELFKQSIQDEIRWALEHRAELAVIAFHTAPVSSPNASSTLSAGLPLFEGGGREAAGVCNTPLDPLSQRRIPPSTKAFGNDSKQEMSNLIPHLRKAVEKELRRKADTIIEDEHSLLVILPDTSRQGAEMVSERMRERIQDYLASQGLADQMSFESRIASLPQDGGTAEDLFTQVCHSR